MTRACVHVVSLLGVSFVFPLPFSGSVLVTACVCYLVLYWCMGSLHIVPGGPKIFGRSGAKVGVRWAGANFRC